MINKIINNKNDQKILFAIRFSDSKIFKVHKYIIDNDGIQSVWCNNWYGRHVVGNDCNLLLKI